MRNMGRFDDALALAFAEGRYRIGQIQLSRQGDGPGCELRHRADAGRDDLERFSRAEDAVCDVRCMPQKL